MTIRKRTIKAVSIAALFFLQTSFAGEAGSALKADSLRFEPFSDAKTTGSINRGDHLEILKKQGAWLQVKAGKNTGWVRLLSVKRGAATSGSQTSGVLALASGRAGTGQVVSTTGVRGLSEEELKAAKFNEAEVSTLESYTISREQGQKFAASGQLQSIPFSNLSPAPRSSK